MEIIQSLIIGVVQGITEFLPVSSSAHLVLVPYFFNWDYKGLSFDVALHFGTVIAILLYFAKDWLTIIKNGLGWIFQTKPQTTDSKLPTNLLWQIALATLPAVIVGFFIEGIVESRLHSPSLLAFNLAFFGLALWLADTLIKKQSDISKINWMKSLMIGLAQALALMPGVSRAGITMIAGRLTGLNRESSARFSFLLGTPAMVGAFFFESRGLDFAALPLAFWVGVIGSALAGLLAIRFLINYLKRSDFSAFTVYRLILAAAILIFVYSR